MPQVSVFLIADANSPMRRTIHSDTKLQRLPVLLVTAEADVKKVMHAAQQGASGYVLKPFTRATLEEKIAVICKNLHLPAPSTCIASAIER